MSGVGYGYKGTCDFENHLILVNGLSGFPGLNTGDRCGDGGLRESSLAADSVISCCRFTRFSASNSFNRSFARVDDFIGSGRRCFHFRLLRRFTRFSASNSGFNRSFARVDGFIGSGRRCFLPAAAPLYAL
jgi:hypothetical protein